MRTLPALLASLSLALSACAHTENPTAMAKPLPDSTAPTLEDVRAVSPALERFTRGPLQNDVWQRPDLSPRDRSIVTLAALIARNQPAELPRYLDLALDNGVTPAEVSEIITHLAFYSGWPNAGWPNAFSAMPVFKEVFAKRPG